MTCMVSHKELEAPMQLAAVGSPEVVCDVAAEVRKSVQQRVLVVDDEESILSALRRLLRKEPYDLVAVNSAQEALHILESQPVSLVISDYRMPRMTGTELLFEVQRRWPETLRIVLSGYSEVKAIISAINEGAIYKFITKPWNDEEIKLHIRRALEQHALEVENRRMAGEINLQNQRLRELNEQLDQRADDASRGLTFAQEILEFIDAGVCTVDATGLIVSANRHAIRLLSIEGECILGAFAKDVLPAELCRAALVEPSPDATGGRFRHAGRSLQWRAKRLVDAGDARGVVVAIWEDV